MLSAPLIHDFSKHTPLGGSRGSPVFASSARQEGRRQRGHPNFGAFRGSEWRGWSFDGIWKMDISFHGVLSNFINGLGEQRVLSTSAEVLMSFEYLPSSNRTNNLKGLSLVWA